MSTISQSTDTTHDPADVRNAMLDILDAAHPVSGLPAPTGIAQNRMNLKILGVTFATIADLHDWCDFFCVGYQPKPDYDDTTKQRYVLEVVKWKGWSVHLYCAERAEDVAA